MSLTTHRQREILAHAINLPIRMKCRDPEKRGSDDLHRNHYCVAVGSDVESDILALLYLGLVDCGQSINGGKSYFVHVTEAGKREILPS